MTRIIILSDNHSGHLLGLTPPAWHRAGGAVSEFQKTFWNWYCENLSPAGYDICLHAGDIVDGEGHHDTSFHLTTDINEQVKIAIETIAQANAKKHIFVSGTPYHAGAVMDYEKSVADHFCDHGFSWQRKIEIEGVKINIAHTIGKSSTPVGGDIMLRKAMTWDRLAALSNESDPADIIIRGHIHEARSIEQDNNIVMTCPALKLGNADFDRYARRMSGGFYTVGFREIDIDNGVVVRSIVKSAKFKTGKSEYETV